ncbi:MAG: S8 family serine peptidase [Ignavibacteriaceae bacterium]|jgi:subtilisin family serine protease|nr:S8 family serine peptidase [Ignavibacteriaceae bacterium]
MNKSVLIIVFFSTLITAQDKYFIYFKDKGPENSYNQLNKNSAGYQEALNSLTEKAVERRIKNMGEEYITFEDLKIFTDYKSEIENLGVKIIRELNWFNSVSAYLNSYQIELIKQLPYVKSVEPVKKLFYKNDFKYEIDNSLLKLSDTTYNYGLAYKQVNLSGIPFIHSKNISGQNVLIGILDSGFDWKYHESLKNKNVIAEYDFVFDDSVTANQSGDIQSQDRHGTYVFSLLAGSTDSIVIGPAFNSSFILAKTEDVRSESQVEEDNYAAALIWMESLGVDITTSSLGYNEFDDNNSSYSYSDMDGKTTIVTRAVNLAYLRGVSTFTSAGNEGNTKWKYITAPADGYNIISVGAVDEQGNIASFSSRGPTYDGRIKPEVVACGVNDYGALAHTENSYMFASGTSASAPIASGIVALLLSAFPHLKNEQIRNIILESSSNSLNPDNNIGYGIISAKNAIEFPNLQRISNEFILHKMIFEDKIKESSVDIVFKIADDLLQPFNMTESNKYDYIFSFPQKSNGEVLQFYITYSDSLNNFYRNPESGFYRFVYGTEVISLNLETQQYQSYNEVSEFFPNPFIPADHKTAQIRFNSSGNELFKIFIIDGAGQKVIERNISTVSGDNLFEWDGFSDRGYLCASGVYYALIQFSGKEYGRKLVLLK